MMYDYSSKPIHMVFPVALFFLGAYCMTLESPWIAVGGWLWLIALVVAIWIVLAGLWAERSRYYSSLSDALEAASKCDLDTLASLGFTADMVPDRVRVDLYSGSRSEHFSVPISVVKMRSVAAALLDGQSFSERRWSGAGSLLSIGEFRALRATLKAHGLIMAVSDKSNQQGFALTDAGRDFMRSWVSPAPLPNMASDEP